MKSEPGVLDSKFLHTYWIAINDINEKCVKDNIKLLPINKQHLSLWLSVWANVREYCSNISKLTFRGKRCIRAEHMCYATIMTILLSKLIICRSLFSVHHFYGIHVVRGKNKRAINIRKWIWINIKYLLWSFHLSVENLL